MPRPLGLTTLTLLAGIRDGRAYGLDLVARTGLPSGTVYPTLSRLERSGLVQGSWEERAVADREGRPRRRYYELTEDGARALREGSTRVAGLAAVLNPGRAGSAG